MKPSRAVVWLALVVALLAAVAAAVGVFSQGGPGIHAVTSLRGQTTQIYGQGLYRYDTFLIAAGSRGTDAVTLAFEIPVLLVAAWLYSRGSLRGGLVLLASLGYFLYYYASMALGVAYNELFLLYILLFSASLFAFILTFRSIDVATLPARFGERLPGRAVTAYLYAVGAVLLLVWLGLMLLPAMLAGQAPDAMGPYTTLVTHVLDLGVITPATFVAAALFSRRRPLGYLLAALMILGNVTMGTALLGQGAAQLLLGVPLGLGAILGFMISFAILTLISFVLAAVLLRSLAPARSWRTAHA